MTAALVVLAILAFIGLVLLVTGVRVVQQFERGVVFRLGKLTGGTRGAGLTFILPFGIDRLQKVNMQIVTMAVPAQDGISRDNVSVRVDAVVYFRVVEPVKAVVNVQNYLFAVSQVAQTSLRSVIGRADLDDLLSNREQINAELRAIIDEPTEGPWGVKIERVEIKDVSLPEGMKRSMSRQAEAERERRARVITADGELQASKKLAEAGRALAADPSSLQLRLLQTVVEVAAERNSTLVMPVPVELLRFFDKFSQGPAAPPPPASADPVPAPPATPAVPPTPAPPAVGPATPPASPEGAAMPATSAVPATPEVPDVPDVPDVPPPHEPRDDDTPWKPTPLPPGTRTPGTGRPLNARLWPEAHDNQL